MAGFRKVGTESQGDVTGKVKKFWVNSSSKKIGIGDIVLITGDAHTTNGYQGVDVGTSSAANTGLVVGVEPQYTGEALSNTYLPASTDGYVFVDTDPGALMEVDVSGTLAAANAGLNAKLVTTEGTVAGGLYTSNMKVNATGVATTSTFPLRIVRILNGTSASATYGKRALVRVNESTSQLGATGIS